MMSESRQGDVIAGGKPKVVVLAGPNGAGKSTAAERLLRGPLRVDEFVNADVIAQGLSGLAPESAAFEASAIMLRRLHALAERRVSFAFETTFASRSLAPWLRTLVASGYQFDLVFLWLPNPEAAIARVRDRVSRGGHDVPESTIRRRYAAGLLNFFELYQPLANSWQMFDNRGKRSLLLAAGSGHQVLGVRKPRLWQTIVETNRVDQ
jgi:predicted ABC-type ATPase